MSHKGENNNNGDNNKQIFSGANTLPLLLLSLSSSRRHDLQTILIIFNRFCSDLGIYLMYFICFQPRHCTQIGYVRSFINQSFSHSSICTDRHTLSCDLSITVTITVQSFGLDSCVRSSSTHHGGSSLCPPLFSSGESTTNGECSKRSGAVFAIMPPDAISYICACNNSCTSIKIELQETPRKTEECIASFTYCREKVFSILF